MGLGFPSSITVLGLSERQPTADDGLEADLRMLSK